MPANIYGELQRQDQDRRRHEHNAAKHGSQYLTWQTSGVGSLIPEEPVMFDLPFFSEPAVTWGCAYVKPMHPSHFSVPQVTGMVYRWVNNRRGFFVGAYLAFRVEIDQIGSAGGIPTPVIVHHFVFSGMSYRELGRQVNEAANDEAIQPLTPPV